MDNIWIDFVKNVGFPIAVACYTLFRLNGKVGANTEAMKDNTRIIRRLVKAMGHDPED